MIVQNIKVMESGPKEDIEVGRQGEYNVRQVVFDLSAIAEAVGPGTATIIHYPIDGAPYTVPAFAGDSYDAAVQDGNTLTWTIGQLATQHKNNGVAVVTWTTAAGLKKSRRFKTKCQPSIEVSDVEQAAQQAYIDQMATIAADIAGSVQTAAGIVTDIETAVATGVTDIENAATAAVQDVNSAVQSADSKIAEIRAAGDAAVAAASAAANVTVQGECLIYGGGANG
jgi:hypothetical protein